MPMKPPVGCGYGTCKAYAIEGTGYCATHTRSAAAPAAPAPKLEQTTAQRPWYWKWYNTAHWRALRGMVLARHPICCLCQRRASSVADHIIPHQGNWDLFCDMANLQGLCAECHNTKTALENGGFGNRPKDPGAPVMLGDEGKAFTSGKARAQVAALQDVDSLLWCARCRADLCQHGKCTDWTCAHSCEVCAPVPEVK
jgi:5-methylcytosine-specific restriction protein A